MTYPTQRHFDCEDDRCSTCLQDCENLSKFLEDKTGSTKKDHLGLFREFIERHGFKGQTIHGWHTEKYFDKTMIDNYINHFTVGEYITPVDAFIQMLVDKENQPHQFVGDFRGLEKELLKLFKIRET